MDRPRPPQSLAEVIQTAAAAPTIAARLKAKFGLGSNPEVRMALYQRLEDLVSESPQGERVMSVIQSVVNDSRGKNDPGHYFAYCVLRRLQERGLIDGTPCESW